MIRSLGQLGVLATLAGVCLVGIFSMSAQAQDQRSQNEKAHVDLSAVNQQPIYPPGALASGEQGTVVVGVMVTPSGKATHPSLDRSSGFADLDNAAMGAVLGWKYIPSISGGGTSQDRIEVGVNFQLPNAPAAPDSQTSTTSH